MDQQGLFQIYAENTETQMQAIFSSVFILQNRLQTACEKLQTDITMKQWLLLAMSEVCQDSPTLTKIGELMGCSRQNVKKLAIALERKGFVRIEQGCNNTCCISLDEKVQKYFEGMTKKHTETLKLLFQDFSVEELENLYKYVEKLYTGISRVENYAKGLN